MRTIPIQPASAPRSVSDDDLCATCERCDYRPGELSTCSLEWPGIQDDDGYILDCNHFEGEA